MVFIQNIDNNILMFIQNNIKCSFLDIIMPIITSLGNGGIVWIGVVIFMLCSKKYKKYGFILAVTLICGWTLGDLIIKPTVERIRPCNVNESIQMLIARPLTYSFPSGHSLNSFSSATIIFKAKRSWGIAAFMLASLIAFSRMYLYVHYPSDVLFGIIIGICTALIIYRFMNAKLNNKKYNKIER